MPGRFPGIRFFSVLVSMFLCVAAFAADSSIGKPTGGGSAIDWMVSASGYDRIQLTVIGPDGEAYVREFPSGRLPSFRLSDLDGEVLDGAYNWELRVIPKLPSSVKNQLSNARNAGDEKTTRRILREQGLDKPTVEAGTFTIVNGSILAPDAVEPESTSAFHLTGDSGAGGRTVAPLDNVVADDQIITGSLCVGYDCLTDGTENFGFDTIKMKENNIQIFYDDTSSTAGFPANDWRFVANDSSSGGGNHFSIVDSTGSTIPLRVMAGAPSYSVVVASSGRIGARTSTPVLDFHIASGDTPAVRFEQTSAQGWTAQTWDMAGNESNFFVRDTTGGSKLPFRIRPGAPTSSIDIAASGNVGIGTASPSNKLQVAGGMIAIQHIGATKSSPAVAGYVRFMDMNGDQFGWFGDGSNASNFMTLYAGPTHGLTLYAGGAVILSAPASGNLGLGGLTAPLYPLHHSNGAYLSAGGVWTNASSRALKTDIQTLESKAAQEAFQALEPVTFTYKSDPSERFVGFIAEDVPDLVATRDHEGLSPMDVVAVLTKVLRDQEKRIDELNQRVNELEAKTIK